MLLVDRQCLPVPALVELAAIFGISFDGSLRSLNHALQDQWYGLERIFRMREPLDQAAEARAWRLLEQLGLRRPVAAPPGDYAGALLLGAKVRAVRRRLAYVMAQGQDVRVGRLILLGSQRRLQDAEHADLRAADAEWQAPGIPWPATEGEMMRYVCRHSASGVPFQLVEVPLVKDQDGVCRYPNTEDTVQEWLRSQPAIGRYLVVTTQPSAYQVEVVRNALPPRFTVAGCLGPPSPQLRLDDYLDCVAKLLFEEVRRTERPSSVAPR